MGLFSLFGRQRSLASLSDLDDNRLSDLGLDRYDLFEARRFESKQVGSFLAQRRNERAHFWLK